MSDKNKRSAQQRLPFASAHGAAKQEYKPFFPGPNPELPAFIKQHATPYDPKTDKFDVKAFDRDLREDVIIPLGPTMTEAARRLGVNRKTLSALVNCKVALSAEMAIRIGKATSDYSGELAVHTGQAGPVADSREAGPGGGGGCLRGLPGSSFSRPTASRKR